MCEEVGIFKSIGAIGIDSFDSKRMIVMIVTGVLSFITFILICVGLGGSSETDENVINCNWANAEYKLGNKDYYSYVGLKRAVTQEGTDGDTKGVDWADCSGAGYCSDCETAGNNALNSIAIAFVLSIPILVISFIRTSNARDLNLYKVLIIIFSLLSLLLFIIAMGSFGSECYGNLPSDDDYVYGPGFNAISTCFVFEIIILVLHILTPVKKSSEAPADNYTSA